MDYLTPELLQFPRLISRGLIEAIIVQKAEESLGSFPRLISRGLIEARDPRLRDYPAIDFRD